MDCFISTLVALMRFFKMYNNNNNINTKCYLSFNFQIFFLEFDTAVNRQRAYQYGRSETFHPSE